MSVDFSKIRNEFPIIQQMVNGKPLVYLDNGATSQKPVPVIDTINRYYYHDNANVHRGVYELSQRATVAYESTRQTVRNFINAHRNHEIIFTRGTTASINTIASCFADTQLQAGDEILVSAMEHHSNIVPWQVACQRTGAQLKVIPMFEDGTLDLNAYQNLLNPRTKMVALIHVSNVLGTVNPVKKMIELAHANGTPVLLDAAQSIPHMPVDVQALDCDFLAFSAHKMYGPTGTGVLYGKEEWLEKLPPYQFGGDMISRVTFEKTTYNVLPHKFEAGTPNMAGVIGMGAAVDYLQAIGLEQVAQHQGQLLNYANDALSGISGLNIIGQAPAKAGVISFVMEQAHPHDIGTILDTEGVAIRAGHHCAMPLMDRLGLPATARASFGIYNNQDDIDRLVKGLEKVKDIFK